MADNKKTPVYLNVVHAALIVFMLFFIIPVFTLTGCGGKTTLSKDAVKTKNIHEYIFKLKELYEEHDERMGSMFSHEYFPKEFNEAILLDFARFDNISLEFFIDRIEYKKDNADITLHWNGIWKDNKSGIGKKLLEGGSMVLLLQYEGSIKITGIKGNSPFGISAKNK